jgi:hypothetical protein
MVALTGETTEVVPADRRRLVRIVLWVLLVASAAYALWGTPRPASQDAFARALKAGDVRAVDTTPGGFGLEESGLAIHATVSSTDGYTEVVWEDASGGLHRTQLVSDLVVDSWPGAEDPSTAPADDAALFPASTVVDIPRTIAATAIAADQPAPNAGLTGPAQWSAIPLPLLTLGFLALLIWGRQPRRVTKWGMFWLLWIPLGIGIGWWLARDAPFAPDMNAVAAPGPGEKGLRPNGVQRTGGGVAFFVAWGVSISVAIALAILIGLLGSAGGESSPVEVWQVVMA